MESVHEFKASAGVDVLHPPITARIVLIDDNPELLSVAAQIVGAEYEVVGAFASGEEYISQADQLNADVAVLDITLSGMSGLEVAVELTRLPNSPKVIFLTIHEELEFVRAVVAGGAMGYVFKSRMATDLNQAIHAVLLGERFLPAECT